MTDDGDRDDEYEETRSNLGSFDWTDVDSEEMDETDRRGTQGSGEDDRQERKSGSLDRDRSTGSEPIAGNRDVGRRSDSSPTGRSGDAPGRQDDSNREQRRKSSDQNRLWDAFGSDESAAPPDLTPDASDERFERKPHRNPPRTDSGDEGYRSEPEERRASERSPKSGDSDSIWDSPLPDSGDSDDRSDAPNVGQDERPGAFGKTDRFTGDDSLRESAGGDGSGSDSSAIGPVDSGGSGGFGTERNYSTELGDEFGETMESIISFSDNSTSASQILMLTPSEHAITNEVYERCLMPPDTTGQNVLFVAAVQSANKQLPVLQSIADWNRGMTAVIEVGQNPYETQPPSTFRHFEHDVDIYKQLSNPSNLSKLGIVISHIVTRWKETRYPTMLGLYTLSAFSQYVGTETLFQFLYTLHAQLDSSGLAGYFHMDPLQHDQSQVETLSQIFDVVVEVQPDGTVEIN